MFVIKDVNDLKGLSVNARKLLGESEYLFYLTGSRFFGTHTEESDFDFFAQYETSVVTSLQHVGFSPETDSGAVPVYASVEQDTVAVLALDNCHVQLVRDINKKLTVQKLLRQNFYLVEDFLTDKKQAKAIWSLVYNVRNNTAYNIWCKLKFEMKCSLCNIQGCDYVKCPIVK